MPKKIDTTVPPVPEWFKEEYASKFVPVPVEWNEDIMNTPDEEVGRLLKSLLHYTITHELVVPEGYTKREMYLMLKTVDFFLNYGLENLWKATYKAQKAAKARWDKEHKINEEDNENQS